MLAEYCVVSIVTIIACATFVLGVFAIWTHVVLPYLNGREARAEARDEALFNSIIARRPHLGNVQTTTEVRIDLRSIVAFSAASDVHMLDKHSVQFTFDGNVYAMNDQLEFMVQRFNTWHTISDTLRMALSHEMYTHAQGNKFLSAHKKQNHAQKPAQVQVVVATNKQQWSRDRANKAIVNSETFSDKDTDVIVLPGSFKFVAVQPNEWAVERK